MSRTQSPARRAIEARLKAATDWIDSVSLRERCGLTPSQCYEVIRDLRRAGLIQTRAHSRHREYRWVQPALQALPPQPPWNFRPNGLNGPTGKAPAKREAQPKREPEIVYPSTYKHQVVSSPLAERPTWTGTNWGAATSRPGCTDADRLPSRRGNSAVNYRPPLCNGSDKV